MRKGLMQKISFQLTVLMLVFFLSGCGMIMGADETRTAMDFTVVEQEEIPEELKKLIEKHKTEEMQIVFEDNGFLYAVRGYGEQPTGGYSIAVDECAESEEYIYIATTLIGPDQTETLAEAPSYPVIVVKIESREKEIIFE